MPYFIIIGAGITGITATEQLASTLNKKVLLIDKCDHIGENCYDYINNDGIIIHRYGPHIFHTNDSSVYKYLSLFTKWNVYNHKVVSKIDGSLVPIPFNLISIDKSMREKSEEIKTALLEKYNINDKIPILELKKSNNPNIRKLADYVYEKVFLHYTKKQWGYSLKEIDSYITSKVPIQISYDCRYFQDIYQGIPSNGYTMMFKSMLSNHNINILLEKDFHDITKIDYKNKKIYYNGGVFEGQIIFTGMIDEFSNYELGKLPYRSLVLMEETINKHHFQENGTINYPNNYHFTRITEYTYSTGQQSYNTTIQFEFPTKYNPKYEESKIPYYPILKDENIELCSKYKELAKDYPQVTFIGSLAEYKYMNMDKVVKEALNIIFEKFIGV